jgi:hypothetical protein
MVVVAFLTARINTVTPDSKVSVVAHSPSCDVTIEVLERQ